MFSAAVLWCTAQECGATSCREARSLNQEPQDAPARYHTFEQAQLPPRLLNAVRSVEGTLAAGVQQEVWLLLLG